MTKTDAWIATLPLVTALCGCEFTVPQPPQMTGMKKGEASATAYQATALGNRLGVHSSKQVFESIWVCEIRLHKLVRKMRAQRTGQAALGIGGGTISAGTGIFSAAYPVDIDSEGKADESDVTVKTVTAAVAAATAIIAVVGTYVGEPDDVLATYNASYSEYRRGKHFLDDLDSGANTKPPMDPADQRKLLHKARAAFDACSAGKADPEDDK